MLSGPYPTAYIVAVDGNKLMITEAHVERSVQINFPKKVLVTGATGLLGSSLVPYLKELDIKLHVLVNPTQVTQY